MAEKVDYGAVLADLKQRRDQLDATISTIEQLVGTGSLAGGQESSEGDEIRSDSFFKMTIPNAAKKYLRIKKKPQFAPEIAQALERGGYTHQSSDFTQTVATTLLRIWERDGTIVKLPNKQWALGEWYGTPKPRATKEAEAKDQSEEETAKPEEETAKPIDFPAASGQGQPS